MNKLSSAVYIFSTDPLFNREAAPSFETFNKENSVFLYQTLILNHLENIKNIQGKAKIVFCFDETDKELLPRELSPTNHELFFGNTKDSFDFLKKLAERYFSLFNKNLIIFSNSIGESEETITKALDLISIDDDAAVIGKTFNDNVGFVGFNTFQAEIFSNINFDMSFDRVLRYMNKYDNFVHVLGNFMKIDTVDDFRILYNELSKKESLAFCSQHIHERFTNLFIEYKDLLR